MRQPEIDAFIKRCERYGLTSSACVLRAAVELEDYAFELQAVMQQRPPLSEMTPAIPGLESTQVFKNDAIRSVTHVCNLCTQTVWVKDVNDREGRQDVEINIDFPLRCNAYLDAKVADLEALNALTDRA